MYLDFIIGNNGNPIVLFIPAKSFRINIELEVKKEEIDKAIDSIYESCSKYKLIYQKNNDINDMITKIIMIFLVNPEIIDTCNSNLQKKFPNLKINKIIFTNDLENNICCTDKGDKYNQTNNSEVNSIELD